MQTYVVTESPVLVRKIASADSGTVNVIPVGGKIYAMGEEAGWLRTTSGYYVFKTDNIILDPGTTPVMRSMSLRATSPSSTETKYAEYMNDVDVGGIPDDELDAAWAEQAAQDTILSEQDKKNGDNQRGVGDILTDECVNHTVTAQYVAIIDPKTGEPMIDEDTGGYVWAPAPDSLTGSNNGSTIQYVMEDGQTIKVEDANGNTYYVQGESAKIGEEKVAPTQVNTSPQPAKTTMKNVKTSAQKMIQSLTSHIMTECAELNRVSIEDARTVFGMPYQFLPTVDPRLSEDDPNRWDDLKLFGRKYKEKIVARAPIFVIQPGLPVFLKGFSDDVKQEALKSIFNISKSELEELSTSQGQFYAFELRARDYFYAVNTACRAVAVYLGIANVEVPNLTKGVNSEGEYSAGMVMDNVAPNRLGSMNWALHPQHPFGGYYAGASYFYINSDAQVSENFSTATRQSELAGKLNQISDAAMETLFLGGIGGGLLKDTAKAAAKESNQAKGAGESITNAGTDLGGAMGSIVKNIGALISGGKMSFPEIWQDSSVGRSYNVTIKLDSPDCDKVSIYLNILVPLIHILGFVLPRFAASNTYITPFLVRCFYKSMFHIDMGMITSCDVVKGDMGAWTQDGLPTQITVSLSIRDLYSILSQSTNYGNSTMLSNPAQMEYLASMCGISVAPANFSRSLELWYTLKGANRMRDQIVDAYNAMMQSVFSSINNVLQPTRWQN